MEKKIYCVQQGRISKQDWEIVKSRLAEIAELLNGELTIDVVEDEQLNQHWEARYKDSVGVSGNFATIGRKDWNTQFNFTHHQFTNEELRFGCYISPADHLRNPKDGMRYAAYQVFPDTWKTKTEFLFSRETKAIVNQINRMHIMLCTGKMFEIHQKNLLEYEKYTVVADRLRELGLTSVGGRESRGTGLWVVNNPDCPIRSVEVRLEGTLTLPYSYKDMPIEYLADILDVWENKYSQRKE